MSRGALGKNNWALFLMLLAGIMLGGFIGNAAAGVSGLSWLNYGLRLRQPDCAGSGHSGDHIRIIDQDYHREHHRRADRDYYLSLDLSSQEIEKPRAGENSCPRLFAYV